MAKQMMECRVDITMDVVDGQGGRMPVVHQHRTIQADVELSDAYDWVAKTLFQFFRWCRNKRDS